MTVLEIGHLLRARKISCLELVQQTFSDIRKRDVFGSFITLTEEQAFDQAKTLDRDFASGLDRGPFHGVPIAYKDVFYTQGIRTTGGSLLFREFVPQHDACVVSRFKSAGAISIGKTNLHELAYGITSRNPHYGSVLNPRDTTRIPGGSSGGSAALIAAGFLPVALGTDTGGSIRIPASYCGITGLKPTYGRISREGLLPLAFSLDHVGPLGSSIEDCALAMNAMVGPGCDFNLPALASLKATRIGVPENFFFDRLDPEVASVVRSTISQIEHHGAVILDVHVPDIEGANVAARIVQLAETASLYARYTDSSLFGEDVWALIQQGKLISAHDYVNAQRIRTLFRREFDALWKTVDALVTPTTPITAPRIGEDTVRIGSASEETRMASTRLVRALNFTGEPALSVPCGKTSAGLPVGLQLVGPPFSEPRLLQIAKSIERILN